MSGGLTTTPATGGGPLAGNGPGVTPVGPIPTTLEPGSCGLEQPAFRETFDTPLSGVTAAISVRPQMELPALWVPGGLVAPAERRCRLRHHSASFALRRALQFAPAD